MLFLNSTNFIPHAISVEDMTITEISVAIHTAISFKENPFAIRIPYCFRFNSVLVVNTAITPLTAIREMNTARAICRVVKASVSKRYSSYSSARV